MALLFMDSFDHYATGDLGTKWSRYTDHQEDPVIASVGRTANAVAWGPTTGNESLSALICTPQKAVTGSTSIVGFAMKITSPDAWYQGNQGHFIAWYAGDGYQCGCKLNGDGTWGFGSGTWASDYTSSGVPIVGDTWQYVEFKVVIHATAGSCEIRVNGTPVLSQTNIDTAHAGGTQWTSVAFNRVYYGVNTMTNGYLYLDDFYLLDGSGSYNNTFWGDTSIRYLAPNATGTTTQWDKSGGSANYEMVLDAAPDGDSSYISTDVTNEIDTYNFPSVQSGASINAVQVVMSAKKGDTGQAAVASVVRHSGTDYAATGLGVASNTSYFMLVFPYDRVPDPGVSAWTESNVNAAEFGVKKTT